MLGLLNTVNYKPHPKIWLLEKRRLASAFQVLSF